MPTVTLNEREQDALRALLGAVPTPGRQLPSEEVLVVIADLIRCDRIGSVLIGPQGSVLDHVGLPTDSAEAFWRHGASLVDSVGLGLSHPTPTSDQRKRLRSEAGDAIAFGFRIDRGCSVQLRLDRSDSLFSEQEVAVFVMITPAIRRLVRERPVPQLTLGLTVQERRVLKGVAAGKSNATIAAELFVASSTVRKHLEHAFRKLGVNSRLAAVAILEGRALPDHNLADRILLTHLANTPECE